MLAFIRILYSFLVILLMPLHSSNFCDRTDLYCYYTKDAQPYCSRGEFDDVTIAGDAWKDPVKKHFEQNKAMASNGLIRPRSALARAFIEKQQNDRTLQEFDKNEWYRVDKSRLSPEMQSTFVQLHADEETKSFLSNSIEKSSWVWTQIWYLLAKAVLKHFWSITDINGWLGRGSMFVLSEAQARSMLRAARRGADGSGSLVDVGAGDGEVSRRFAHLYGEKYATEISASMRKTLLSKGYTLLDVDDWWRTKQFDCVCMLNLLDRCSRPRSMLRDARAALAPGGLLLLALVLPYKPYVEVTADHKPEERLGVTGAGFEEQATALVEQMRSAGWALRAWARAPYLCEGDFAQAYYWLDDSVYVFQPAPIEPGN
ncbi:methyltransferase-like protein 9 [Ostrinia furnacalis]|uniref:methyltransferase-like protein 9 n=1 Tax=Ostrinia furnacalis TaxID=93504 RepID=UPI00103B5BB5|nr:methyltransferase-like protein 9 [Ostrinia furnacalis]